jgi:hypothetical protein
VADYFVAGDTITARGTVIGTPRVLVASGAKLILDDDDIANQTTVDRFTPTQAWAAAGQGSLEIDAATPLSSVYTVAYMLEGIYPTRDRTYKFATNGGDLPAVIPAGAKVTTYAAITDAPNHALTVNGELIANNATFELLESLTISSSDTDNNFSRAASIDPWITEFGSSLQANSATLANATIINIGDRGEFYSESVYIELPAESKITLGRSAIFNAAGLITNNFDNLASLWIGPAAKVAIDSSGVTFKSLEILTLQDGASLSVPRGAVTFLVEATPSTPPKKTEIVFGKNAFYNVSVAPTAKVDVGITNDASLVSGSMMTVNEGSTFTLAEGKTLAVESGATVNFDAVGKDASGPIGTAPTVPPIKIEGAIEIAAGGRFIGPDVSGVIAADPSASLKFVDFGTDGKIVANRNAIYEMGDSSGGTGILIMGTAAAAAYKWSGTDDGAQIVMDESGITIRDGDGGGDAKVFVGGPSGLPPTAYILKEQTLYLDAGVELVIKADYGTGATIWFAGAAEGGAKLMGPGALVVKNDTDDTLTTITGGSKGWQAVSADSTINIGRATGTITGIGVGPNSGTWKALGPGAVITQAAVAGNELRIQTGVTIALGGDTNSAWGAIVLKDAAANPGKLSFTEATAKILLGDATATSDASAIPSAIGGKAITISTSNGSEIVAIANTDFKVVGNYLVQISCADADPGASPEKSGYITPNTSTPNDADVTIASNLAATIP